MFHYYFQVDYSWISNHASKNLSTTNWNYSIIDDSVNVKFRFLINCFHKLKFFAFTDSLNHFVITFSLKLRIIFSILIIYFTTIIWLTNHYLRVADTAWLFLLALLLLYLGLQPSKFCIHKPHLKFCWMYPSQFLKSLAFNSVFVLSLLSKNSRKKIIMNETIVGREVQSSTANVVFDCPYI